MSGEIAKAVEWMTSLDARFATEIRGTDPDRIEKLEAAQGHPCPEVHREFLLTMGAHPSWFFVHEIDFRLPALLKWHERNGPSPAPEYTLIGADRSDSQSDFYLEKRAQGAPEVVSFPWHEGVSVSSTLRDYRALQAGSLPELICRVGFELYRLGKQPEQKRWDLPANADIQQGVDGALRGLGLRQLWFSNPRGGYYEHAEAAVRIVTVPGCPHVLIAGASARMMPRIRQSVEAVRTGL